MGNKFNSEKDEASLVRNTGNCPHTVSQRHPHAGLRISGGGDPYDGRSSRCRAVTRSLKQSDASSKGVHERVEIDGRTGYGKKDGLLRVQCDEQTQKCLPQGWKES